MGVAVAMVLGIGRLGFVGDARAAADPPAATADQAKVKTVLIPVEGMSCVACAASVKKALTSLGGVSKVEVNLAERNARVRFDSTRVSPDRLVAAIDGLGYHAGAPAEVNQ
jgi:copper chaperone CopZ